jgi:hypothetical protein
MRIFILIGIITAGAILSSSNAAQAQQVVITCAQEHGTCLVPSTSTVVSYGYNGAYVQKQGITNSITCDNDSFGGDPLVGGKAKSCSFVLNTNTSWSQCGVEDSTCILPGAGVVRFGDLTHGKYVYDSVPGSVPCTRGYFGDPDFGTPKICYVAGQ